MDNSKKYDEKLIIKSIKYPLMAIMLENFLEGPRLKKTKHNMFMEEKIFLRADGSIQLTSEFSDINNYKLKCKLENLERQGVFWDIMHLIRLMKNIDYLQKNILEPKITQVLNDKYQEIKEKNPEQKEYSILMQLNFILDIYLKSFFFDYRIFLDEMIKIIDNLNILLTKKTKEKSKNFKKFFEQYEEKKYEDLNNEIKIFLDRNKEEFYIIRDIRNSLKKGKYFKYVIERKNEHSSLLINIDRVKTEDLLIKTLAEHNQISIKGYSCDLLAFVYTKKIIMMDFIKLVYSLIIEINEPSYENNFS